MSTMSDFVNSGASNQAQVDANTKILQYMPNRNRIINGKMEVAQRGTNFAALANNAFVADRFFIGYTTTAVITSSVQPDAPTEFKKSMKVDVTTSDTSIAANDFMVLCQCIEGYNVSDLIGKTFTLSFWVKSKVAGLYSVCFRAIAAAQYVTTYTINSIDTWEKKTIVVVGGFNTSGGTWNFDTGIGIEVAFALMAGTNYCSSTLNSWIGGNILAYTGQVNFLNTTGNTFFITGIQLEAGESATPFEHRPYGQELALCQRYFYKVASSSVYKAGSTGWSSEFFPYPVTMRSVPTVSGMIAGGGANRIMISDNPVTYSANYSTQASTQRLVVHRTEASANGDIISFDEVSLSAEL